MRVLSLFLFIFYSTVMTSQSGFYNLSAKDIDGNNFDFSSLKGKKVMIVNVASKCGFTPQYKQLQELWERYSNDDFVIIGFPANNFMWQEPGNNADIKQFCSLNYNVTFPMMSKISVKGSDISEVYKWLTNKSLNGKSDSKVSWNFQKYLIDENGYLTGYLPSKTTPDNPKLIKWIETGAWQD